VSPRARGGRRQPGTFKRAPRVGRPAGVGKRTAARCWARENQPNEKAAHLPGHPEVLIVPVRGRLVVVVGRVDARHAERGLGGCCCCCCLRRGSCSCSCSCRRPRRPAAAGLLARGDGGAPGVARLHPLSVPPPPALLVPAWIPRRRCVSRTTPHSTLVCRRKEVPPCCLASLRGRDFSSAALSFFRRFVLLVLCGLPSRVVFVMKLSALVLQVRRWACGCVR